MDKYYCWTDLPILTLSLHTKELNSTVCTQQKTAYSAFRKYIINFAPNLHQWKFQTCPDPFCLYEVPNTHRSLHTLPPIFTDVDVMRMVLLPLGSPPQSFQE